MKSYREFDDQLQRMLRRIGAETLSYHEDEFWMIQSDFEFIEYYAAKNRLINTAAALQLARGLHDGAYRKATVIRDDVSYKLPYVIHPIQVCRVLIELNIPLPHDELDILFASALCHDMLEDIEFPRNGRELTEDYGLDEKVLETVRAVTKRRDFTEEEELQHFKAIARHKLAMLVKAADRGNNVEDLYNRSSWKVHEYVGETRKYFFPMLSYGAEHYPELGSTISIIRDKIFSLTVAAEFLVGRYDQQEAEFRKTLEVLRKENLELRTTWNRLWHQSLMEDEQKR